MAGGEVLKIALPALNWVKRAEAANAGTLPVYVRGQRGAALWQHAAALFLTNLESNRPCRRNGNDNVDRPLVDAL